MSNFNTDHYTVIKGAISKEMTDFMYDYICLRRKIATYLFSKKLISPFSKQFGHWRDPQAPNTYTVYGDTVMETLLLKLKPMMEKETAQELVEMYSYCRIYKKNDVLNRHRDRNNCEISTTLFLGKDPWPIYLDPTQGKNQSGIKIELNAGDMLIYKGCLLEHWRETFTGNNCAQVFLHYSTKNESLEKDRYDGREFIGEPDRV
jgi:hypothetical protein